MFPKMFKNGIIGQKWCNMGFKKTQYRKNGQNCPKQTWANDLIFKYIEIFLTNIFI